MIPLACNHVTLSSSTFLLSNLSFDFLENLSKNAKCNVICNHVTLSSSTFLLSNLSFDFLENLSKNAKCNVICDLIYKHSLIFLLKHFCMYNSVEKPENKVISSLVSLEEQFHLRHIFRNKTFNFRPNARISHCACNILSASCLFTRHTIKMI